MSPNSVVSAPAGPAPGSSRPGGWSHLLVTAQFALLAGLAVTAARPSGWAAGALLAAGLALGFWAVAAMPLRQLRIVPEVHPRGSLVRAGPYRRIRHPMYTAVLLVAGGLFATAPALPRGAMMAALALVLAAKLLREEHMLQAAFPEYAAYQAATWRLVPWIW